MVSTRVETFAHNSTDTTGLISCSFQHLNQHLAYTMYSTEICGIEEGMNASISSYGATANMFNYGKKKNPENTIV